MEMGGDRFSLGEFEEGRDGMVRWGGWFLNGEQCGLASGLGLTM